MSYTGLNSFVKDLELRRELVRIKTFVSPDLEITEVTDRVVK